MKRDKLIKQRIEESINVKQDILNNNAMIEEVEHMALMIAESIEQGGKLFLCGNGGSALDALHIRSELIGRFEYDRCPYPAIALSSDIAGITSIANDYSYEKVFSRQIECLMNQKDILFVISTSGNSINICEAVETAKKIGSKSIALLGRDGGRVVNFADYSIIINCNKTARIQESHIMIGHIIVEIVESYLVGKICK